jgi:hypothetical protein
VPAIRDVSSIFAAGRRCLLRSLLAIHRTFEEAHDHSGYYLLNKVTAAVIPFQMSMFRIGMFLIFQIQVWISDLSVWIQKIPAEKIAAFAQAIR